MSASKKGLGRGFDSLIPTDLLDESFDPTADQDGKISDLRTIKITEIHPDPDQPRRHFDQEAIAELASSVREHGIIQPLVVAPRREGGYTIVAGERRYRAAQLAQLEKIPAIIRTLSSQHKLELSIIENVQRKDLTAIEVATAYVKLRDQFNLTMEEIGQRVGGKSVSAVTNTLRLLKLPHSVKEAIADGRLSEGQARPLIGADLEVIEAILPRIIAEHWSAREVERAKAAMKAGQAKVADKKPVQSLDDRTLKTLEKATGTRIKVTTTPTGSGSIALHFKTLEDRARLIELLKK